MENKTNKEKQEMVGRAAMLVASQRGKPVVIVSESIQSGNVDLVCAFASADSYTICGGIKIIDSGFLSEQDLPLLFELSEHPMP